MHVLCITFIIMKNNIISILIISFMLLAGCGSARVNESISHDNENTYIDIEELNSRSQDDGIPWIDSVISVAPAENGMYIADSTGTGKYLFYYDYAKQKAIYLCNKPECIHNDNTCNAFLPDDISSVYYDTTGIRYYDNSIFFSGLDSKNICLFKISADGTSREKVMDLFEAELNEVVDGKTTFQEYESIQYCIHRGYIYYIVDEGDRKELCRKKLGSKSDEEVITADDTERTDVYRMEMYGKYLFFQRGIYTEDFSDIEGGLYAYDVESNDVIEVKKDVINVYVIKGDTLYYEVAGEGIYGYSLRDKSEKLVVEIKDNCFQIAKTNNGFVVMTQAGLIIFDNEGKKIADFGRDKCDELKYVNNEYMVVTCCDENVKYYVVNISNENPDKWEWNEICLSDIQ